MGTHTPSMWKSERWVWFLYLGLTRLDGGLVEAGGSEMFKSHPKQCSTAGDGQPGWQKINSWNEAIRDGAEPSEQPDSQKERGVWLPRQRSPLRPSAHSWQWQEMVWQAARTPRRRMHRVQGIGSGPQHRWDAPENAFCLGARYDN